MLRVGECITKIRNRVDPCLVKIPLVPVKNSIITDHWLRQNARGYLPTRHDGNTCTHAGYLPHDKYRGGENGKHHERKRHSHQGLLIDIFLNPMTGVTQRYRRLGLNP